MIHISANAANRIRNIRETQQQPEQAFLRVSVIQGGCSGLTYKLDFDTIINEDDEIFVENGEKIVTSAKNILYLFDTVLDFSEGLNGKGFHFLNPNASRTCSCGESFAV
ncbi:MAG: iron-sulfur cluster assembly accessory protein [Chitinophagales bacterium]|nr:iron-sulfur cluster assembly accessory protein [Bacteroidota bacterium]MCB9043810.1 iron-sulfur cluster assembly accessory protein [Chitinophagales bacterium]